MNINLTEIKSYYKDKLQEFGGSARGMDWKNEETQYLRFEIISRYIDFSAEPTILDVGCGNSEFLNFCSKKELACRYTGMDLVPEMVKLSNDRFGPDTAIEGDLFSLSDDKLYDYVIASGTFNAKLNCEEALWKKYFYKNIQTMFQHSSKAILLNCMSHHVDYRYDRLYYVSDEEISNFIVKDLSRKYILDHSYPLFEMTIAIFR